MASQDSATSSAGENPTPAQDGATMDAPPNVFQLQNRRFFLFQEAAMWLPEEVFQQLAEVEVAHLAQANKYLEEFIQNNKVQRDPVQGKSEIRLPSSSRRRGPNRQEVESLVQAAEETAQRVHDRLMPEGTEAEDPCGMRQGSLLHRIQLVRPLGRSYTKPTRRAPQTSSETSSGRGDKKFHTRFHI